MRAIVLRLDAPMMSFGTVLVDRHGVTDRFPGTAMLTGLIGNAMGWHHRDAFLLQELQARLEYAARWDVAPRRMIDYHTVDLSQRKMCEPGWTTRGVPEHRAGGESARFGTHQRSRHYWMDGLMTVVLSLKPGIPTLDEVVAALQRPARPIFLGRKTCLPSRPLLDPVTPVVEGEDLFGILQSVPLWNRAGQPAAGKRVEACWPAELRMRGRGDVRRVFDLRDWPNQIPAGSRLRAEGVMGDDAP